MKMLSTLLTSLTLTTAVLAGTPTIDGVYSPSEGWGTAIATGDGTAGWNGSNAKKLYVTYDNNYVYFGGEGVADAWQQFMFIVNTKPGGDATDPWGRTVTYGHANKPDFIFRGDIFNGMGAQYAEYHVWNGTAWTGTGTNVNSAGTEVKGTGFNNIADGFIEIRVPRSIIGWQTPGEVQFIISGNTGGPANGHGCFDAVPNDNNGTSWNAPNNATTVSNYAPAAPLPVVFGDVKAFKNRTGIEVNWAVATEINIDEYQVQRSANGTSFSTIKTVPARNVGNLGTTYAITDATALKGKNYYRVVAVENGDLTYSRTAFLNNLDGKAAFTVALQPAGNILVVKVNGLTAGNYNINLVNNNGQLLQTNTLVHDGADVVKNISLKAGLAAGIYRVVLTGEGQNLTQAIMVR